MKKITVLIVDDHAIVRKGLTSLLGSNPRFSVIGEAKDGESAVLRVRELKPDVVIMDLMMPRMNGSDATAAILAERPETRVLVLTTFGSFNGVARALDAGATGVVLKNAENDDLVAAIAKVAEGEQVISPEIRRLMRDDPPTPELSPRQHDVLALLVRGFSNGEIAHSLNLRENSVKKIVFQLFERIGAANRAEAVAIALRKHLSGDLPVG